MTPVCALIVRRAFHVFPPSAVLKSPRSPPSAHSGPTRRQKQCSDLSDGQRFGRCAAKSGAPCSSTSSRHSRTCRRRLPTTSCADCSPRPFRPRRSPDSTARARCHRLTKCSACRIPAPMSCLRSPSSILRPTPMPHTSAFRGGLRLSLRALRRPRDRRLVRWLLPAQSAAMQTR